jgi:DNA-binding NtrC family response regulator/tetratricopeptide (TPR) repeat protein
MPSSSAIALDGSWRTPAAALGDAPGSPLVARVESLAERRQHREALTHATRGLKRRPIGRHDEARLRLVRGWTLWLFGPVASGKAELLRAGEAGEPLVRARAGERLAIVDWRALELDSAQQRIAASLEVYRRIGSRNDECRALEIAACLARERGRLAEAHAIARERLELAERIGAERAAAHAGLGSILTALGRWSEARQELDRATSIFREQQDPREVTLACMLRGALELATGELEAAQQSLMRASEAESGPSGTPRGLAEVLLLVSDLHLAAGDARAAEAAAADALVRYSMLQEERGEARCRIRLAQALLALGRTDDAVREASRAVRLSEPRALHVTTCAQLGLGRTLLRSDRAQALAAFERTLELAPEGSDLSHAARLGRALARGEGHDGGELRAALEGLARWGDRRILAFCLADVRELIGRGAPPAGTAAATSDPGVMCSPGEALVEIAERLSSAADWTQRVSAALGRLFDAVRCRRAVLICDRARGTGIELRRDLARPLPVADQEPARVLSHDLAAPALVDLAAHPATAGSAQRALHGVSAAAVVPVGHRGALYLDFADGTAARAALPLAAAAARLLAALAPAEPAACEDEEDAPAFPEIVGRCAPMRLLFAEMARVAASELPVHIFGETGTGKERVARALHRCSKRRERPFVAVNASSLSDELFEAEMFGHVRGAFTGAIAAREGHVALAEGGTLFIDEVADLSPRAQAKLLRLAQDGEYRRIGDSELRRASVRILTAANAELEERVARGLFREDLMYRLCVVTLRLPPLRQRGDDLLLLARHFLRAAAARERVPVPALPADVARALLSHAWPGNVRELENEMSRLVVLGAKEGLRREHLRERVQKASTAERRGSLREASLAFERDFVARALQQNDGNRARTAAALGLTRQALLKKMGRLGLS